VIDEDYLHHTDSMERDPASNMIRLLGLGQSIGNSADDIHPDHLILEMKSVVLSLFCEWLEGLTQSLVRGLFATARPAML
jgi:hypothetical protein